jgi:hypothetical protein
MICSQIKKHLPESSSGVLNFQNTMLTLREEAQSKSQVLADFVLDWTSPTHNPGEDMLTPWVVQCDGAWCHKGVGISVVVTSLTGIVIRYVA